MSTPSVILKNRIKGFFLIAVAILTLAGCSDDGPAIEIRPQSISFGAAPAPGKDAIAATVSATATSGLAVTFLSKSPQVCSVNSSTGAVHGNASGTCTIEASQSGNDRYAPAAKQTQRFTFSLTESITFTTFPVLSTFDTSTVAATTSTGKTVAYRVAPASASICTVTADTGLVTALAPGDCTVFAEAGTLQAIQTITVSYPPLETTAPAAPGNVTATLGDTPDTVKIFVGAVNSGGQPVEGYTVTRYEGHGSTVSGVSNKGPELPVTATCPSSSCAGYSFTVAATNATGTGPRSTPTDVITSYNVIETFYEPETQPRNSIFIGTFTLNSTTGVVSNLRGTLSESMTGDNIAYPNDTMTWLTLDNQLSSVYEPTLGGLLVTTFKLSSTDTFDLGGFAPGGRKYFGFTTGSPNNQNAYAMIFVNTANPLAAPSQAQIDKLAYADCAPGGMMGATCMTGIIPEGYGAFGTMGGYPISQVITKR